MDILSESYKLSTDEAPVRRDFGAIVSVIVGTPGHDHLLRVRFGLNCTHLATQTTITRSGTNAEFNLACLHLCHPFDKGHDVLVSWHHFNIIVGSDIANAMLASAKDLAHDSGEFVL